MTFFYDLNKKIADLAKPAEQLNERSEKWIQKAVDPSHKGDLHKALHVPQGEKIPKGKIEKATHSKNAHLRHMAQFAKNVAKEDSVEEGFVDTVKQGAQAALGAIGQTLGHGSDEDMIRDLQKKAGVPVTGKVQPQQQGQQPQGQKPMAEDDMEDDDEQPWHGIDDPELLQDLIDDAKVMDYDEFYDTYSSLLNDPGEFWENYHDGLDEGLGDVAKKVGGMAKYNKKYSAMESEGGTPMTAKQKSFAKLAPPKDKITFADKIAGAKKEVDEMLGDVAAEAMKSALKGGQKKLDVNKNGKIDAGDFAALRKGKKQVADEDVGVDKLEKAYAKHMGRAEAGGGDKERKRAVKSLYVAGADKAEQAYDQYHQKKYGVKPNREETDEGWDDMLKDVEKRRASKVGDVEHGSKHDIEHTATGRKVTRRVDDKGISVGADDDKPADGEKRGRGRPKKVDKAPERVTGKAYKHKGGRKSVEEGADGQAQQIYNDLADIRAIAKQAQGGGAFPQGFASRLESALWAAMTLIKNQQPANAQVREEELDEKAVSQQQQKFMGMVHAMQKGEKVKGASKELKKVAKTMKPKDVKDFAATKHEGLPKKKKKEVEETTVAGSVAASAEAPKSKGKGGMTFGKGIYDSLNRDLEAMISESMNVSVNMSQDEHGEPHKNITVSAEGEAAEQLAQLLNLAGISGQYADHEDCGCGTTPCSCNEEMVDENAPDWPTEPETIGGDDPHLMRYADGLDGPKDGQTTIPVVNRDPRRGSFGPAEYATDVKEDKDLGMKLYAELKSFKA